MTTTILMEFLRLPDISITTQSKNILFFADSYSAYPQGMSFLQNVKFVCCPPQCKSMMPYTRTEYV